jgi:hypothetical protein
MFNGHRIYASKVMQNFIVLVLVTNVNSYINVHRVSYICMVSKIIDQNQNSRKTSKYFCSKIYEYI